ncbi:ImmA/IrrE family metallo-endopeptidase [Hutsoniella sourekii]|uniref:ImmA/IrrE family metallo-endopeptidase n=1 Tax=Hutsoniella sourekii TaxID=87650 RepID=UPI000488CCB0|nr:ImmA/IrrE family metallo-endopeptidase [Hutsoniella sourekii]
MIHISKLFRNLINNDYIDDIYDGIIEFIDEEIDSLDLKLKLLDEINEIELEDFRVKHVHLFETETSIIEFQLVVETDIAAYEISRHDDDYELVHQWLILDCSCEIENLKSSFNIKNIDVYRKGSIRKGNKYDENLIPIMKKEDYEKYAHRILENYYPEALNNPTPINPLILAEKIGVKVIERQIDKDCLVFGQTYFKDKSTEFYELESDSYVQEVVKEGTIVVDPQNFFLRNIGSVSNTIAHEIVHWVYHKNAFLLQRLNDTEITNMTSLVKGGMRETFGDNLTEWMERQANALAPKILMPLGPFKTKAFSLIRKLSEGLDEIDRLDSMSRVIDELASFFLVSKQSVKIRLLETGFREVLGINIYLDNDYVLPHKVSAGVEWPTNITYSLDIKDAAILSISNPVLSDLLQSGKYQFIDNHFVLNHPDFVQINLFGQQELTNYARTNIDICCLPFEIQVTNSSFASEVYFTHCILCRDADSKLVFNYSFDAEGLTVEEETEQIKYYLDEVSGLLRNFPRSFPEALTVCMEWSDMSQNEISEKSHLDVKTIQRLKNGETTKPDIKTIICLCIGMKLHPEISLALINESPYKLGNSNQDLAYRFILTSCYTLSIEECNQKLAGLGVETL